MQHWVRSEQKLTTIHRGELRLPKGHHQAKKQADKDKEADLLGDGGQALEGAEAVQRGDFQLTWEDD